ncbi:MAG: hypothetical protein IT285_15735 [Bdellovibrionales bacterium]|nr:hypothetical protein [Bdellovibrionales bacterium]
MGSPPEVFLHFPRTAARGKIGFLLLMLLMLLMLKGWGAASVAWAESPDLAAPELPPPTSTEPSLWRSAKDSILVFFEEFELFDSEAEIDRAIGNPWELNESTALKLKLLPLYLRYPIYYGFSGRVPRMEPLLLHRVVAQRGAGLPSDSFAITGTEATGEQLKTLVLDVLGETFTPSEIADLAVFMLSGYSFFPTDMAGWNRIKRAVADSDIFIALGVLIAGAVTDEGSFSHSGTLFNWSERGFRLGWYGSVNDLGIHFHPRLRGGMSVRIPGLEVTAGLSERIDPGPDQERRALELALRESWLSRFASPAGWELYTEAALRHVFEAEAGYTGPTTTFHLGLHARRDDIWGIPSLAFRASGAVDTDFQKNLRLALNLAVENSDLGLTGLLQGALLQDLETGSTSAHAGLFLAGSFESERSRAQSEMMSRGGMLRQELEQMGRRADEALAAEARLELFGTGTFSRSGERANIEELESSLAEQERHATRLGGRLAGYLEARRAFARVANLKWSNENHGPVEAEVLLSAKNVFDSRLVATANALIALTARGEAALARARALEEAYGRLPAQGYPAGTLVNQSLAAEWSEAATRRHRIGQHVGRLVAHYESLHRESRRIDRAASIGPRRPTDPLGRTALNRARRIAIPW